MCQALTQGPIPCVVHTFQDPALKKRVGRMFGEFFEIPNAKFDFVRQRSATDLARKLNGGLPEIPADTPAPVYPKHQIKNLYTFTA